jgi:hypothetical protein
MLQRYPGHGNLDLGIGLGAGCQLATTPKKMPRFLISGGGSLPIYLSLVPKKLVIKKLRIRIFFAPH